MTLTLTLITRSDPYLLYNPLIEILRSSNDVPNTNPDHYTNYVFHPTPTMN